MSSTFPNQHFDENFGKEGLRVVRFRDRYFTYLTHHDSYPAGFGESIVRKIPSQPEQYKVWLDQERSRYQKLTEELESKVLVITQEKIRRFHAARSGIESNDIHSEELITWKQLDRNLYELPSPFCDVGRSMWAAWVYIVDLDRELFSINNYIHFKLSEVSSSRWLEAFSLKNGNEQEGATYSFEAVPESFREIEPPDYFIDCQVDRNIYRAKYQEYQCLSLNLTNTLNVKSRNYARQLFALSISTKLVISYTSQIFDFVPVCPPTSFAFREMAYAIICLMTAQFYFDGPFFFYRSDADVANGYLADREETQKLRMMPAFGSMCHMPNQEPGCAPLEDMYWFHEVLIALVSDLNLSKEKNAIVSKVVEFGKSEGRVEFRAVLFSIRRALMLEVNVLNGVTSIKQSAVEPIISSSRSADNDSGIGYDPLSRSGDLWIPLPQLCETWKGFVAMQNFMIESATSRWTFANSGCFPIEIYAKIIAEADYETQLICSRVCKAFRALAPEPFHFSRNLSIVDTKALDESSVFHIMSFIFRDRASGRIMHSVRKTLDYESDQNCITRWCPVIGHGSRACVLTELITVLRLEEL